MGFILDGLESESYDREYRDRDLFARILSYFRPFSRKVVLVAGVLALNSIAGRGAPIPIYEAHASGKIVRRVTSDPQDFSDVVTLVVSLLSQILLVGFLAVWLVRINAALTGLLLVMAPFAIVVALSFRRVARRVTQNARRVTAKINAQIQESISGITVAKAFRKERSIYNTFDQNNRQAFRVGLRRGLRVNTIFLLSGLASGGGVAVLMYAR